VPCGVDPAEKQHSQKHLTLINCVLLEISNLSWPVGDAWRNNCPRSIRLFRIVICLLQMSFVRWWESHKGMFSWSSKQKPKPNSTSTMHCLVVSFDCWAIDVNWERGGGRVPPIEFQIKRDSSLFTTYSNFCGAKVALTQVVEHHLPTYVSLALAWQKGGSENLHEIQNKMKVHRIEKTTNTRHQICRIRK